MVNSPKSEVIEGGGKLARALNDKGVEVTFGKRSEGNDDLSTVIDMAANQINSSSGGSADIVTSWESTLSDTKVPSEKLTKETIDTKISKSQTTGLVKNDGTIDTTTYISDVSGKEDTSNKVTSWSSTTTDTHYPSEKLVKDNLDTKQATLVSGTNIKTVNNNSLLGSGNITIQGGGVEVGTFTDLQSLITSATSGDTLILDKDYKYDSTTDSGLTEGVIITKNITLIGNGHIIDGNNSKRAFFIIGQHTFNLSDLRIQNCTMNNDAGGAIHALNGATGNINNTQFTNNTATSGGAIHIINGATVSIKNSSFQNNTASSYANIYCSTATTVYNCDIDNISNTCYNVTNKPYLTDHQSIPSASTSTSGTVQLVDNLTTNDDSKALTAKQGKALYDLIAGIENDMLS